MAVLLGMLDEFATLGRLEPLGQAEGLMASYGVQLWAILQDLHQLKALYGERHGAFLANAAVTPGVQRRRHRHRPVRLARRRCGTQAGLGRARRRSATRTTVSGPSTRPAGTAPAPPPATPPKRRSRRRDCRQGDHDRRIEAPGTLGVTPRPSSPTGRPSTKAPPPPSEAAPAPPAKASPGASSASAATSSPPTRSCACPTTGCCSSGPATIR